MPVTLIRRTCAPRLLTSRRRKRPLWISSVVLSDILAGMTKRLVDVDDAKLDEVRALLGTSTTKATVNRALEEVLALAARRRALLDDEVVAGSADLAGDEQRRATWA